MYKSLLLFIALLLSGVISNAQDFKRKTEKLLDKSQSALASRNWEGALRYMDEAVASEPDNFQVHLEKAVLYYSVKDISKMLPSLKRAYQLNETWKSKYHEFYFILGKESFEKGAYEFAKGPITNYLEKGYNKQSLKLSKVIHESIGFAMRELKLAKGKDFKIKQIEASQVFRSIYFPFFTLYPEDNLYFTAQRTGSLEEGIYRAELTGNKFKRLEEIPNINSDRNNEGAAAISADGRVMVFTSCNRQDGYGGCDLYISYKRSNEWSAPENLGSTINTGAWESQPYLSSDGRLMIFSSNRKGGLGKRDLYYSVLAHDGLWGIAKNLGSGVNTFADETSPFLSLNEDSLYFSSNGRVGMGGFDFFKVDWQSKLNPTNIGLPVNSYKNEISYHQKLDGSTYWARELESDDKYPPAQILYTEGRTKTDSLQLIYGRVSSKADDSPLASTIQIYDLATDSLLRATTSDQLTGNYKVLIPNKSEYSFYVEAPGYLFNSIQVSEIEGLRYQQDFKLEKIKAGRSISLNNLYFEFDSYKLNDKSRNEINKIAAFMKANLSVLIEIAGYTDNVGSKTYNQDLSEKRARTVYEEILKITKEQTRLRYKGYGAEPQSDGISKKIVKISIIEY